LQWQQQPKQQARLVKPNPAMYLKLSNEETHSNLHSMYAGQL
jgi:hypothetical protein